MTAKELISKLSKLWLVIDTEKPMKNALKCVTRTDVLQQAADWLQSNELSDNFFFELCDIAESLEPDVKFCDKDVLVAFRKVDSISTKKGEMCANDLCVCMAKPKEADNFQAYVDLCHRIGIVLDIDTSEDVTNSAYWDTAFDDQLNPLEAVLGSV